MKQPLSWIAILLTALLLAACSTTKQAESGTGNGETAGGAESGAVLDTGTANGQGTGGANASGAASGGQMEASPLQAQEGPLSKHTIYFDFDSSEISQQYADILKAHGEYLAVHPEVSVTVEGHTDERGSREYNLALGERRAKAVKQILTLNGAAGDQVDTVSYGEEKPAVQGHDESAWAKNRRAELVYKR